MTRRAPTLALLGALLLTSVLATTVSAADPPLPSSMAAVGDSITQAASSAGSLGADAPQNSWSTGSSQTVQSHALRLQALGAPLVGRIYNRSVSGAKMADLNGQMQIVAGLKPDYVTVLIGGNDLCTDTVAQMTSVTDFRAQFETAMGTLMAGSPNTHAYVVSIPNVYQLWDLFKGSWRARLIWSSADICQSLLANPTSTQPVDVERRAQVSARNEAFNLQMEQVCAAYARCRFDGNASFNTPFTTADVSGDYFHPSVAGQAKLASVSWGAGYAWAVAPPASTAMWVSGMSAATSSARNSWTATVTVQVTDATGPLSGVAVSGTWSTGSGSTTCTTGGDGRCTVTSSSLNKKTASVAYTVDALSRSGWTYQPASNVTSGVTATKP